MTPKLLFVSLTWPKPDKLGDRGREEWVMKRGSVWNGGISKEEMNGDKRIK